MKPNIFLLTIDSIRSNRFYGPEKTAVTPNFDYIIKNGMYFEQNISSSDQTGTSLATIFTGKYPINSGITQFNFNFEFKTFFDDLKDMDYNLYSCINDLGILKKITKNFKDNMEYVYSITTTYPHLDNNIGNEIIGKFLDKKMKEPWVFYSHLLDLKDPIVWSKKYDDIKFGKTAYDRNLSALDEWIGKFLEYINLDNTLFVITTDHGDYVKSDIDSLENSIRNVSKIGDKSKILERLGKKPFAASLKIAKKIKQNKTNKLTSFEKRNYILKRSGGELFDDLFKVPLMFVGHGINQSKIISTQVRHVDIFPTIFDHLKLPNSRISIDGKSNVKLFTHDKDDENYVFMESGSNNPKEEGKTIGIRTSKWKYFRDRDNPKENVNLYNLKNDPKEEKNLSDINVIANMERAIENILENAKTIQKNEITDEQSAELEEELRKMGYI